MEDSGILTFEDFKNQNGITFWWASDLMLMLGYTDMVSFRKVIDRATRTFITLNIPHYDNIVPTERHVGGECVRDFKLTRFACYVTAMNGDPKKPEVAMAQAYFGRRGAHADTRRADRRQQIAGFHGKERGGRRLCQIPERGLSRHVQHVLIQA